MVFPNKNFLKTLNQRHAKNLCKKLKEVRKKKHIPQHDMASLIGVRLITLQRWEKGSHKPSRLALEKIERIIEIL